MPFDCTIERSGDTMTVAPEGDVDAASAAALRQVLQQVVEQPGARTVEVDMSRVTFLDSSGLGVLVAAHRAAQNRGASLRLRDPGPMVKMVLEVTNLDQVLVAD